MTSGPGLVPSRRGAASQRLGGSSRSAGGRAREQFHALRALGEHELPERLTLADGRPYVLVRRFKHDFFAATAQYARVDLSVEAWSPQADPHGMIVVKAGRVNDFLGLPMAWLGRYLTRHEVAHYRRFTDLPGVPGLTAVLAGETAFAHAYVPGRPLQKGDRPGAAFWSELRGLLDRVHAAGCAYVDLNKRQNILLGEDGRPWLIDFQISYGPAGRLKGWPVLGWLAGLLEGWILRRLQDGDNYHFAKHKFRLCPELCTEQERRMATVPGFWIRLHRRLTQPLQGFRRATLQRVLKAAGEQKGPG